MRNLPLALNPLSLSLSLSLSLEMHSSLSEDKNFECIENGDYLSRGER